MRRVQKGWKSASRGPVLILPLLALAGVILFSTNAGAQGAFTSANPDKALVEAMEKGDRKAFSLALIGTTNLNATSVYGAPFIVLAVESGDPFFVAELLKAGARPDEKGRDGRTALTLAAERGYAEMVKDLLDHGSRPDHQGVNGEAALVKAARHGHVAVIRALIEGGADVNEADVTGRTALDIAERGGHTQAARILREAGAEM
jgi:uncharacterized protein